MKKNSEEKKNFNFKASWSKINEKSFMPLIWLTLLGVEYTIEERKGRNKVKIKIYKKH